MSRLLLCKAAVESGAERHSTLSLSLQEGIRCKYLDGYWYKTLKTLVALNLWQIGSSRCS